MSIDLYKKATSGHSFDDLNKRYSENNNMTYLGEGISTPSLYWTYIKSKSPTIFLNDVILILWTPEDLTDRALSLAHVKPIEGRSPTQLIEKNKLQLLINLKVIMMQHQYWMTKQAITQKFGRKEDECIVSSDAQLDAKLELFRNIQMACTFLQKIINRYQECICLLSQETNSMGRFLKENSKVEVPSGGIMLTIGKSLIFCAQKQLILHEPLMRMYEELETFRQRAIGDTLQNILLMEKARTEFRATLSWMKNVSLQLDPDTSKKMEKFKKVQEQVKRRKINFDKLSLDCLQKVDLLAAARCNMFNHVLCFYYNRNIFYTNESADVYSTISRTFQKQNLIGPIENSQIQSFKMNTNNEIKSKKSEFESNSCTTTKETFAKCLIEKDLSIKECDELLVQKEILDKDSNTTHMRQESNYDELRTALLSESNNIMNDMVAHNMHCRNSLIDDLKNEDQNIFFPSNILAHCLKTSYTSNSTNKVDNSSMNENNVKLLQQNDKTKTWLKLFEDLDPLSNTSVEKSLKSKNSCI